MEVQILWKCKQQWKIGKNIFEYSSIVTNMTTDKIIKDITIKTTNANIISADE